jgi:predicted ester cyclase
MSEIPSLDENLSVLSKEGRTPPPQAMRGFDPQYQTIVDYIVRITHRIWEEADMGYIYDTYAPDIAVHTGYGTSYGVEEVIGGSVAFLAALPDRRMYAEDVIWTGDDTVGFHTSHLIANTATNTGFSPWGPPTGKRVNFLAIANCFALENRITEEWLVRDTGALIRQLGFDLWEVAGAAAPLDIPPVTGETDRLQGQLPPAGYLQRHEDWHIEDFIGRIFHQVFNGRHFNLLAQTHHASAVMRVPGNLRLYGVGNIRSYLLNLLAMFPDAAMTVEHLYWLGDAAQGYRVAVRWRLQGTHRHYGFYGKPTGKCVNILGVSHLHVDTQQVTEHVMVFDELAVAMQLI